MKITEVYMKNYKSIRELRFQPREKMNVFIGENSVGKSNIFDAINWLLGPIYPTFNSTKTEDHYLGDPNNKIKILLSFDNGFVLDLDESKDKYQFSIRKDGSYQSDIGKRRELFCSAYLGIDRQILDYLPSNRWSLFGRILLEVNRLFLNEIIENEDGTRIQKSEQFKKDIEKVRDDLLFSVRDEKGIEIMKKFIEILQKESARQLNKPESDFSVDLNLYDPWNFYRTLQLIVKESDTGLQFQASSLGMGIQASISIAVLKAYSELKLKNDTPIFIDEPELFLHPLAQRNFYRILRDLTEKGTQLFICTHSPDFLSVEYLDEIVVVRKSKDTGTYLNHADVQNFVEDFQTRRGTITTKEDILLRYKNAYENTGDTQKANEAFFAKKIVLVEGQSEALVIPYFFDLVIYDYIKEGVSIVRCGGKDEIDRFYRLYVEFGIPCFVIFDGDAHLAGTDEEAENIKKNQTILELFGVHDDYPDGIVNNLFLGFRDEFQGELGYAASKKGLELFIEVKKKITNKELVPAWVNEIVEKIQVLPEMPESVLRKIENDASELEPF
jgi:putative ATP-dependent endonuclease of OLD family